MMYWCVGMYGSASTWTFNLVQKLAACLCPDRPILAGMVYDSPAGLDTAHATVVVKTHFTPIAEALSARARVIVVTIRDPRDAVASAVAHLNMPFEMAVAGTRESAALCARLADDPRTVLMRFEDRFFDDPATITRIAATFSGRLSEADFARILAETRRAAIDRFIAGLDQVPGAARDYDPATGLTDTYDPRTQWHKHHGGRTGETGRWRRELTAGQVAIVEAATGELMRAFGYSEAAL